MTVLAIGAVILGLVLAPNTTTLTVRNGVGEVAEAGQVTALVHQPSRGTVLRITYVAPDYGKETLLAGGPAGLGHPSKTYHGKQAKTLLGPVTELVKATSFTKTGTGAATRYHGRIAGATLVTPAEAALVHGYLAVTVKVTNGYVVDVLEKAHLHTPLGATRGVIRYGVTQVDGWTVPKG